MDAERRAWHGAPSRGPEIMTQPSPSVPRLTDGAPQAPACVCLCRRLFRLVWLWPLASGHPPSPFSDLPILSEGRWGSAGLGGGGEIPFARGRCWTSDHMCVRREGFIS